MNPFMIVVYLLLALFLGIVLGIVSSKINAFITRKILEKNAKKVLNQKMNNTFKHGGETMQVNKFRSRDKDGNETELKFIGEIKNG